MSRRAARMSVLAALLVLVWTGCRSRPDAAPGADVEVPAPPDEARIAFLVERQALRAARLDHVHRSGVASLSWTDESGTRRREPQVELTLWHRRPAELAIEIRKAALGTIFWVGGQGRTWWFFDLTTRGDRVAWIGSDAAARPARPGLDLSALAVIDLLGLTPIPAEPRAWSSLPGGRLEVVVALGDDGNRTLALRFPPTGEDPESAELRDADGDMLYAASYSAYVYVDTEGVAPFDRPRLPERVVITARDDAMEVRLTLVEPPAPFDPSRWDRLFDFERLCAHLRPDRTELLGADGGLGTGRRDGAAVPRAAGADAGSRAEGGPWR